MSQSEIENTQIMLTTVVAMKPRAWSSTIAIFGVVSNDEGELLGSGSLVQIGGSHFGLTAAHVLDGGLKRYPRLAHSTSYGAAPEMIQLPIPCKGPPSDIGVFKAAAASWAGTHVTFETLVDYPSLAGDILFIQGFSGAKSHFSAFGPGVASEATPFATVEGSSSLPWFDPELHIAIEYPIDGNLNERGEPVSLPDPRGFSGSLLWKTNRSARAEGWNPEDAEVIGVVTTWDPDGHSLIATRSWVVREFLTQAVAAIEFVQAVAK